jgi:pyruvate dehydrogenase E2 component (dihydrolipoamide acetyltransferase)
MARNMGEAWRAPMFSVTTEIDMGAALAQRGDGVTLTDIIVAASADTLVRYPRLNAHYGEDAIVEHDEVNVGLAVSSDKGLTVPVIHRAETLALPDLAARRRELVQKARAGQLRVTDMTGGTFTISNLGMFDVARFTAIINPPQVAILAVGAVAKRFVWRGGEPEWRDIAEFSLTCDHRAADGAIAASFLARLKERLEAKQSG